MWILPIPRTYAPAVSTPFIVVSRRMKKASKSSIPFASDPLAKLKHMGRTAVKKLESLGTANVPGLPKWLSKVGERWTAQDPGPAVPRRMKTCGTRCC